MQESIAFLLRVQCRRKESSRSLSHLLMSFLFYIVLELVKLCVCQCSIKNYLRTYLLKLYNTPVLFMCVTVRTLPVSHAVLLLVCQPERCQQQTPSLIRCCRLSYRPFCSRTSRSAYDSASQRHAPSSYSDKELFAYRPSVSCVTRSFSPIESERYSLN